MIATLHDQPGFSELFMADLLSRNSRIEEDLIDQLFNSSEKRLARVLLLLANFGKEATVEPIIGKFSQENCRRDDGSTRSRVSFFMNKFRKLGYIQYDGKLEIRNSLLNVVLYDKPEIRNDRPEQRAEITSIAANIAKLRRWCALGGAATFPSGRLRRCGVKRKKIGRADERR